VTRAGLTVAITGPTGDIGRSLLRALDRSREVGRIVAMARRPFDPAAAGLRKVEYRRGDNHDRDSVRELVAAADVVVHLAFLIFGKLEDTRRINLEGTRQVFEETVAARVPRLVYASSVAAYGFASGREGALTEETEPQDTGGHYYSAQKAELEQALSDAIAGGDTHAYVFRPSIVAGPDARTVLEQIPYFALSDRMPAAVLRAIEWLPVLKPVLPDTGIPFQLVHHDDVALAFRAAVLGRGLAGVYNLAADPPLTTATLARALGWYSVPAPELALDATAEVISRLPFMPAEATWIESMRQPMLMDTSKARRELRWRPRHDGEQTLEETVRSIRSEQLIR
jgi:UDP-glucose 4-epimerase